MKKLFIILLTLITFNVYPQCPDSIALVNNELCFYWIDTLKPTSAVRKIEMDTFDGACINTITLNGVYKDLKNGYWSFCTKVDSSINTSTTYTELRYYNNGGNSVGTKCTDENPLPVSLISFDGVTKTNENVIKWSTAMEWNCKRFDLIINTNTIVSIPCTNTNSVVEYTYVDKTFNEVSIYELVQYDYDGTTDYLGAIKLYNDKNNIDIELLLNTMLYDVYTENGNKKAILK